MDVAGLLQYRNLSAPIVSGMKYYFRLWARNAAGDSPLCFPSARGESTLDDEDGSQQNWLKAMPLEKPGAPRAVKVLGARDPMLHDQPGNGANEMETNALLEVEWQPPQHDGGLPILGFRIAQICDAQGMSLFRSHGT